MAKEKTKDGMPNKHLHARVSYLQQIAKHLVQSAEKSSANHGETRQQSSDSKAEIEPLPHGYTVPSTQQEDPKRDIESIQMNSRFSGSARLASELAQIARKSQIRLPHDVKHQICKHCSTVLVEGSSCKKYTENLSKGGKKAHADVFIIECGVCGALKRFPVGARRQTKKSKRQNAADQTNP